MKDRVASEISKVVVGREKEAELLLVCMLAKGHVLLEGVPGVSKTLLAKAFARCVSLDFGRVQFTPDMLPLDIVGGFVFNLKTREFDFKKGPVFTNVLVADEINRAPPKVQSALLESMQELQVTVEGRTEKLPAPFMLIATQNPVEFQGVYPLPEGQVDRFMVKATMDYPSPDVESRIIKRNLVELDVADVESVVSRQELGEAFEAVAQVKVSDDIMGYLAEFARASRMDVRVRLGASPRSLVHLAHCARAFAYIRGRGYVIPDDVKFLTPYVIAHRLRLDQTSRIKGERIDPYQVVRETLDKVKPPR
ncbi:MAG TPA: MoxR family ATPase [Nitrososphaerales archaeon]|nr:MoxR family ATPase [Nitrososphaerales archaeon]